MKNPFAFYINWIRKSIIPTQATHEITMDLEIKKGERTGKALVPCAIYALSHSVDLNPTLVVRRTGERRKVGRNEPISFHPDDERLELEDNEHVSRWEEEQRCPECQRKIVVAEVAETRYRSCPEIQISVSDPVKETIKIPAKFGIRMGEIRYGLFFTAVLNIVSVWMVAGFLFKIPLQVPELLIPIILVVSKPITAFSNIASDIPFYVWSTGFVLFWVFGFIIPQNYRSFKVWQWYEAVKSSLRKVPKARADGGEK